MTALALPRPVPRALFVLAIAFLLAVWQPLWLLLLAPLLLGVPHVAADFRYLLIEPRNAPPRRLAVLLAVPLGAMLVLRVVYLATGWMSLPVELTLGVGCLLVAGLFTTRARSDRLAVALAGGVALAVALSWPGPVARTVGHLHNFVAVALWLWWLGPGRGRVAVVAGTAAGVAVLAVGAFDAHVLGFANRDAAGLTLAGLVATLAPDLPGPWGLRAVLIFAWMQAVHYGFWLLCMGQAVNAVPERTLRQDLGAVGLTALVLGTLALPLLGLWSPFDARNGYLSLVLFHGWLELSVAAWLGLRTHA